MKTLELMEFAPGFYVGGDDSVSVSIGHDGKGYSVVAKIFTEYGTCMDGEVYPSFEVAI